MLGEARVAALGLGADGVEVHEPRLEERARHLLEGLVHAAVELDLVVEGAEDVGDAALFVEWRAEDLEPTEVTPTKASSTCTLFDDALNGRPPLDEQRRIAHILG